MDVQVGMALSGLARCPHCNVATPNLGFRGYYFNQASSDNAQVAWCTYECQSCNAPVVAGAIFERAYLTSLERLTPRLHNNPPRALVIFPAPAAIDDDLPDKPRRYLEQAIQSIHSPDGAVMLAGSAIDAMLKVKGYTGDSVYSRIEQAVTDGILTKDMSQWAHSVRLAANEPRHADLEEPHATPERARLVIEFAKALGDFLFVFPARVARGKEASEQEAVSAASA